MTHLYVITEYKTCMHAIVSESYINYSCTLSSIERLIIFHIYSVTRAACNDPRHNWRRGHMATTSGGGGTIPEAASVAAAAAPSRVALHGVIGSFDPAQEEWYEYAEMLTHYFVADEKKRAILLTVVGPSTNRLMKTLASRRLEEHRFAELVELATKHYNPRPSPIVKRFEFNSRSQKEGETIAVYVAELRKIAEHCEYGEVLSDMLRDRLVCGTNNKGIQTELTFGKAMEVALAVKAAEKDSLRVKGGLSDKNQSTPLPAPPPLPRHLSTKLVSNINSRTIRRGPVAPHPSGSLFLATGVVATTKPPTAPARRWCATLPTHQRVASIG